MNARRVAGRRAASAASACALTVVVLVALAFAALAGGCAPPTKAQGFTGSVYHVATTGDDLLGDGSAERPWNTISHAAEVVSAGDTVHVAQGTYRERVTIPASSSGSDVAPTTFVADGRVVVERGFVVEADHTCVDGFEVTPGQPGLAYRVGQVQVTGNANLLTGLNVHDTKSGAAVAFDSGATGNTLSSFQIHRSPEFGIVFGMYAPAGGGYSSATSNTALSGTVSETGGWCAVEMNGSANTVDGLTISGGPSGWNTSSPGVSAATPHPDGDGIRVLGPRSRIRNTIIHDLWEWFDDTQHTDCVQFWTDADGLLIENCILGTWQPGPAPAERRGLAQEIGPSQIIMAGTVPSGQRITFTVRNTLFLGECGSHASIVTALEKNATLKAVLYGNTFWSSRPSLTARSVLRNNIFRSFYTYPTTLSLDSDYNFFCWVGGSASNNVPWQEGKHSIGRTYATRKSPGFANPDITQAAGWGLGSDFRPVSTSPAVRAGIALTGIVTDLSGSPRGTPPDMGALEHDSQSTMPADEASTAAYGQL